MSDKPVTDQAKDVAQGAKADIAGKPGMFDKSGAIGSQFQPDGNLGSVGEKIGGPLSSQGAIGKQFTADGSIGGTVQQNLGGNKQP